MKRVLICPSPSPGSAVSLLARQAPLAALPLLGQSMVEYWLSNLALEGVKQVRILAHDRPELLRRIVGDGARWGLEVSVLEESRELNPAQALLKYPPEPGQHAGSHVALDHFPGFPEKDIFTDYRALFDALQAWMPRAVTPDRVGLRNLRPGVWTGCRSIVSPEAELKPPCWIGNRVYVGPGVTVGPHSIIEDGAFVEGGAELVQCCVGAGTFVGKFARLEGSFAFGSALVDWRTNSVTEVPDAFLLCALHPQAGKTAGWFARLAEAFARGREEPGLLWKHLLLNKES